jgi:hypothetical protein
VKKTLKLCIETAQKEVDHAKKHPYDENVYKYPHGGAEEINKRRVAVAEARVERLKARKAAL